MEAATGRVKKAPSLAWLPITLLNNGASVVGAHVSIGLCNALCFRQYVAQGPFQTRSPARCFHGVYGFQGWF